jgi:hypothetical protein
MIMGMKCKQTGCPHEYECCCFECDELKGCESSCTLKPVDCGYSVIEGETDLQVFKNANIEIINTIAQLTAAKKQIEEQEKTMKEKLLEAMEKYGVTKFDNDIIKVTYYAPSTATTIDSTRLKNEKPEIAKEYSKTSNKKSYIKIEVKAGDK